MFPRGVDAFMIGFFGAACCYFLVETIHGVILLVRNRKGNDADS